MHGPPPSIPEPTYDEGDNSTGEGDLVVCPVPKGRRVTLAFAGPYEAFLTLDDQRVTEHTDRTTRRLLTWQARHLPALYRALEHRVGLAGVLDEDGVVVCDAIDLERGAFFDHVRLRQLMAPVRARLPAFALVEGVSSRAELSQRLRSMFAAGAFVEVRTEEAGRALSRRRLQVGRG